MATYNRAVAAVGQTRDNRNTEATPLSCSPDSEHTGAIQVQRLPAEDSNGHPVRADGALIHHWWAGMFIKGVRAGDVLTVLQDYNGHAQIYAPHVSSSKLLEKQGTRYYVVHETVTRNVFTVGLKFRSVIDWSGDDQDGFSSHSTTLHVIELEHAGTPEARERSPAQAKGWMWATNSWWHVTPKADGTCVTYEMMVLTRDVPWGWGWLLRGVVERFPATTLTDMLGRTRNAVLSRKDSSVTAERSPAITLDEVQTRRAESKKPQ